MNGYTRAPGGRDVPRPGDHCATGGSGFCSVVVSGLADPYAIMQNGLVSFTCFVVWYELDNTSLC